MELPEPPAVPKPRGCAGLCEPGPRGAGVTSVSLSPGGRAAFQGFGETEGFGSVSTGRASRSERVFLKAFRVFMKREGSVAASLGSYL